jgi:hypothetical protein
MPGSAAFAAQSGGPAGADLLVEASVGEVDPGELGGAAPDVDHQGGGVALAIEQVEAAGHRQLRFLLGGDDLERQAGFLQHPLDEGRAVLGDAAGLGGDGPDPGDLPLADPISAGPKRGEGALHGRLLQPARPDETLAQAYDPGIGFDDPKAPRRGRCDQQPAIIGSEVQGRITGLVSPPLPAPRSRMRTGARPGAGVGRLWRL